MPFKEIPHEQMGIGQAERAVELGWEAKGPACLQRHRFPDQAFSPWKQLGLSWVLKRILIS